MRGLVARFGQVKSALTRGLLNISSMGSIALFHSSAHFLKDEDFAKTQPCPPLERAAKKRKQFASTWQQPKPKQRLPEQFWLYPPECYPPCNLVRFDELFYRPSNKYHEYQRTWSECVPKVIQRRICCWQNAKPLEVPRRKRPISTGHAPQPLDSNRLVMPHCRAARIPPKCSKTKRPSNFLRAKCPFPSFTECFKNKFTLLPERPRERRSLSTISLCETYRTAASQKKVNKQKEI